MDPEDTSSTSHQHLRPAQVSANQEVTNIPKGMGFEKKTLDLLALLTAHAKRSSPAVAVVTQPSTPASTRTSSVDVADKK